MYVYVTYPLFLMRKITFDSAHEVLLLMQQDKRRRTNFVYAKTL